MNILILHDRLADGAQPDELDNLEQAAAVERALKGLGHQVRLHAFDLNLADFTRNLRQDRPDLVFNLVESVDGSCRLAHVVPAVLESLDIPYTGSGVFPLFITGNKLRTKEMLCLGRIPTPRWFTEQALVKGTMELSGAYILKPVFEHGSVGIDDWSVIKATSRSQLQEKLLDRHANTSTLYYAERFVEGREFNLSILPGPDGPESGPVILPPAEIRFENWPENKPRIVGYSAKWDPQTHESRHTVRRFEFPLSDMALLEQLRFLARSCWTLFELGGYGRVDFRITKTGEPMVVDVNPNPCLAPDSGLAAAAACAGMDYAALVDAIVKGAATP